MATFGFMTLMSWSTQTAQILMVNEIPAIAGNVAAIAMMFFLTRYFILKVLPHLQLMIHPFSLQLHPL